MHDAAHYRDRAERFRAMAKDADAPLAELLETLARDYDALAERAEPAPPLRNPTRG